MDSRSGRSKGTPGSGDWSRRNFLVAFAAGAIVACGPVQRAKDDGLDASVPEGGTEPDASTPPPDPKAAALRHKRHMREAMDWDSSSWPGVTPGNWPRSEVFASDCERDCAARLFAHEYV